MPKNATQPKGVNTPSVKWSVKRQDPIEMHCDVPKWVFKRHYRLE